MVLPGLEGLPVEITPQNSADQDRVYKGLNKGGNLLVMQRAERPRDIQARSKLWWELTPILKRYLGSISLHKTKLQVLEQR